MTLQRPTVAGRWPYWPPGWTVPAAALVAALGRLPFLGRAPSPDEAGYLLVGEQWNGAGSSLYGNYWVDRPPGLVAIFRLASHFGGITALRLIGCLAVAIIVLGVAQVARTLGDERSARWAAVIAAALCLSPDLGVQTVNGELLAAPFVVTGIALFVRSLHTQERRAAVFCAAGSGALAWCAVMVKQNFIDVAVFASLAVILSWLHREVGQRRLLDISTAFGVGLVTAVGIVTAWTAAHGTPPQGVFDAMYPFRIEAGDVIAASGGGHAWPRLVGLVLTAAGSGLLLLVLAVLVDGVRSRRRDASTWAIVGLLVFAAVSILLGGSYWHHYLIGLVVPVSIAAGLMAGSGGRISRALVAFAVGSAALAYVGGVATGHGSAGQTVGTAIRAAASSDDTVVSLYGHPDIVQTSGLTSPYEHLWSLPIKTLDPDLTELDAVLNGSSAPTWLVTGPSVRSWGLDTREARATIVRDYRPVATICDRTVYLRDGIDRTAPTASSTCDDTAPLLVRLQALLP